MQRNNSKLNQETPDAMPSFFEKIAEFKRKRTLQPLFIVVCLFSILHCTGVWAMQPYTVQILTAYEIPMESDKATALLSFVNIFACFVFFFVIRFTGKRRLYLTTATGIFLSSLVISVFGFIYLPSGFNSFDQKSYPFELENKYLAYIPLVCMFLKEFCFTAGVSSVVSFNILKSRKNKLS